MMDSVSEWDGYSPMEGCLVANSIRKRRWNRVRGVGDTEGEGQGVCQMMGNTRVQGREGNPISEGRVGWCRIVADSLDEAQR